MAVAHRLFGLFSPFTPAAKNNLSSFLIRSLSSSSSTHGPSLDPEIDLKEAAAELEKSSSPSSSLSRTKGRNFHWVFLGCPGVGKGTYASRLSTLLGVPHIATGDLVREELSSSGLLSSQVSLELKFKIFLICLCNMCLNNLRNIILFVVSELVLAKGAC